MLHLQHLPAHQQQQHPQSQSQLTTSQQQHNQQQQQQQQHLQQAQSQQATSNSTPFSGATTARIVGHVKIEQNVLTSPPLSQQQQQQHATLAGRSSDGTSGTSLGLQHNGGLTPTNGKSTNAVLAASTNTNNNNSNNNSNNNNLPSLTISHRPLLHNLLSGGPLHSSHHRSYATGTNGKYLKYLVAIYVFM